MEELWSVYKDHIKKITLFSDEIKKKKKMCDNNDLVAQSHLIKTVYFKENYNMIIKKLYKFFNILVIEIFDW